MRKLRKNLEPEKLPAVLFVPNDTFDPDGADVITVTDPKIYSRILEGVNQALATGREGVSRETNNTARTIIT